MTGSNFFSDSRMTMAELQEPGHRYRYVIGGIPELITNVFEEAFDSIITESEMNPFGHSHT